MKKLIILLILFLALMLSGCANKYSDEQVNQLIQQEKEKNSLEITKLQDQINQLKQNTSTESTQMSTGSESVSQLKEITYTNSSYNFSLKFPQTWKGYTVKNRILSWGSLGTSDSIDFGFPSQDSLFNISVHAKNQWQNIQGIEGPKPTYLGENKLYVFGYDSAQDAKNSEIIERMKEIKSIVQTFIVK
ncbi:MAG: hypothetical protein WC564_00180 [Patescibacteria group bacterium]|jgi:hypothetical protein